jgi:hypothetical protein
MRQSRPIDEEPDRLVLTECGNGLRFSVRRRRQRWDPPRGLAVHIEGFATRGEHRELGARPEQGLGDSGTRPEEVFAVVETDESIGVGEILAQAIERRAGGVVLDTQGSEGGRSDEVGVP